MQGCFVVEVVEAKAILEGLKPSKLRSDPLLVESDALNVVCLCVDKLFSMCEVDNLMLFLFLPLVVNGFPFYKKKTKKQKTISCGIAC
ncbi:hypothetical protein ACOSQ3_024690 [Xanthoceras sorbifolium]